MENFVRPGLAAFSTGSALVGVPLMAMIIWLVLRRNFHPDWVGDFAFLQVLGGVLLYNLAIVLLVANFIHRHELWIPPQLCRWVGILNNFGGLLLTSSMVMRYVYFHRIVVLEKQITRPFRWIIPSLAAWGVALLLSSKASYSPRAGHLQCTASFYSRDPWDIVNTSLFICLAFLGAASHGLVCFRIVVKYRSVRPSCQTSALSDILRKSIPIGVLYLVPHVGYMTLAMYELVSATPSPIERQLIYLILHSLGVLASPFMILLANPHIFVALKLLLHIA